MGHSLRHRAGRLARRAVRSVKGKLFLWHLALAFLLSLFLALAGLVFGNSLYVREAKERLNDTLYFLERELASGEDAGLVLDRAKAGLRVREACLVTYDGQIPVISKRGLTGYEEEHPPEKGLPGALAEPLREAADGLGEPVFVLDGVGGQRVLTGILPIYDGEAEVESLLVVEEEILEKKRILALVPLWLALFALYALADLCFFRRKIWEPEAERKRKLRAAEEENERLRHHAVKSEALAYRDSLTGVKNKVSYDKMLEKWNQRIAEGETAFAMIMLDVNGLKDVNDTLGHAYGDLYLQRNCKLICDVFAHSPVYRIGGDEFLVVAGDRDFERIPRLVEELRRKVEQTADPGADPWEKPCLACGVAVYEPGTDQRAEDVFLRADKAMYEDKQRLKNLGFGSPL